MTINVLHPRRKFASFAVAMLFSLQLLPATAQVECSAGVYLAADGDFVVLTPSRTGSGLHYFFRSGLRGELADPGSPVSCGDHGVTVRTAAGTSRWGALPIATTDATFMSYGTKLRGQLVEPSGRPDPRRPLVVLVHGSEKTPAIGGQLPYIFAAQGISVFVYDKRGTGASEGDYTQNFELLADDAAAALNVARRLAAGRFGRVGYYGGSQAGWVAPLAATQSAADFVAVGFGLANSPIDEDREQMHLEAASLHLDADDARAIDRLSRATAIIVSSHFQRGFAGLARIRRELAATSWFERIEGEYSGDMMRMSDADLRRVGRARFDGLGLIWDYDATAALKRLKVPLLWVLAGEDREAPIADTRKALSRLATGGQPVDVYQFPQTDHGMVEFREGPDGTRTVTRVTDGYFRLVGDWIKGRVAGRYGRAEQVISTAGRKRQPAVGD